MNYVYQLRINGPCQLSLDPAVNRALAELHQMAVTSKIFTSYGECENNLGLLLSVIGTAISELNHTAPVIVSKARPAIKSNEDTVSEWDLPIVAKYFLADPQKLKNSILHAYVTADISIDSNAVTGANQTVVSTLH